MLQRNQSRGARGMSASQADMIFALHKHARLEVGMPPAGVRFVAMAAITWMLLFPVSAKGGPAQDSQPPSGNDQPAGVADSPPEGDRLPESAQGPNRAAAVSERALSTPTAEQIMKAFERQRPANAPVRPRHWRDELAARRRQHQPATLLREGEYIHNVAGRLTRQGFWWLFTFESDSTEAPRPPLRLLPNQQLERIVMEYKASAQRPVFLISGEVTLFEAYNYLLVRKALRQRTTRNLEK